jgi:hypothetical protein
VKQILRFSLAIAVFLGGMLPVPGFAVSNNPTPDCSAGTTCTITFTYTGDYYAWVIPAGVTAITVSLAGAQGESKTSAGGKGGKVSGVLDVTGGGTAYIYVGGQSGWNGGGTGGTGGGATMNSGSGGGATDIRIGGTALTDRKVVAGGGGGAGRGDCVGEIGGGGGYPGGFGGTGGSSLKGSDGGTNGGAVNGSSTQSSTCTWSTFGGGGGGQNGGGGAGGYGTSTGGSGGSCGGLNTNPGIGGSSGITAACAGTGGNGGSMSNGGGGGGGGGWYGGGSGGGNYGSGGGGGSSYLGLMTSTSYTNADQSGNGTASITYLNTPTPTTFSTAQTSPANFGVGAAVSYTLTLSQSVSDLATSDFKFGGTSTCDTPSLTGSGTNYTVTVTNCSEGTLILQLKANSITGTSVGPAADSSANTIVIDRTLPTISAVTAPANGSYKPSDTPTFSVQFSESVTITGTPRLVLTVGTTTKYATYFSKSDSRTALFKYTVGASTSEFDSDGITLATDLDLNSGSVLDSAGNALIVVTLTPPTLSSVLIVQPPAPPSIDSIAATSTQLAIYFTPGTTYGSAITNYQYSTNNGSTWTTRSPVATTSPILIAGLTNNTAYPVRLRAISAAGNSDSSSAVTGTPTLIVVSGDATLTTTFGSAASTGTYSASGGTGPYAFSISSTANGVSISSGVVTVSASTSAGTYTRDVIATDSLSQTGAKQLTITVRKASSTISLALQGGGTDSPVGQAPVLLITTSLAGSVDFLIGGGSLSGCTAITIASTSGSCTLPAPPSTGSVTVTAVLTPTASGNYETSTATFTLTIVDGVSTISISLAGGVTQAQKGKAIVITATINQAGKVTFMADGKRIPKCYNLSATVGNKTCSWTPSIQKQVNLTASLTPTNSVYRNSNSSLIVQVIRRTGTR